MACFLFMNIEQGNRMAVRMIFHTLLPSLNIAATNHVPQTTFSVFSHFFCFFFFILLLSFMILSFQFSPSSYLSNFSKYMTSSLLPFRPHRLVSSFLVIPDLHNDLLLLLYFFITFFHSSLLWSFVISPKTCTHDLTFMSSLLRLPSHLFPSTGLLVLCQKQWWWRATSWQWGRWMMLSTPPSSVRSRIGSGPAGTKSPLLSLVSLLTQWQHTHKQAHTPCICVDVCTNEMEIHVYLPVNMMNTHWWPNTILHHTQQEYSKQHVITACTHIHSHTHTHTLWAMLVPWQYSTLSQCTYACTYSLIRLFRWMDTLADTHAQKHTFLSHPCTHSGIRADLRAAGMLISLSLHIGLFFFNVFLLTGQILARHSGGLWLTLSPQQGQNARQGPVFITSDRKHSLETELCTATLQRESVALLDANSKWIVVYDRPFYKSFGPAVDAAVLGLLDDSQILSRGSSWCEPVCPGLVFFLFFFFCLVFSYLFLSLHFFWLTLTKQGNWVVHIFFPLSPLNFSFW